jgi:hypothetical protein
MGRGLSAGFSGAFARFFGLSRDEFGFCPESQNGHPADPASEFGFVCPATQPAEQAVITQQDDSQGRVYRLVGSEVVGPDGQTVGKVDDLLLDRD